MLFRHVRDIWRVSPNAIWFPLASAIFRDGLTGVFTFGGVLEVPLTNVSPAQASAIGAAAHIKNRFLSWPLALRTSSGSRRA
jgi:MFS transporter, UMF1 family